MRAYRVLPAIILALGVSPAWGQVKGPAEVSVPVGKLVALPLTVEADESSASVLGSDYFGGFREFTAPTEFRFQLLGYAPGSGYVVVSSVKGGKLQPLFVVKVTVTGAPVPPPVPPPPVPPVPPVDPLVTALKNAARVDGWPAASLYNLAARFALAGSRADGKATVGELLESSASALASTDKTPPNVRAVLAPELRALDAALPPSLPDRPLTAADRQVVKSLFVRLSALCEEASK